MYPWDILDIAKTTDEREIRKAYARVLKTIDQELEPEKFISLREALEAARREAYYASLEQPDEAEADIFADGNSQVFPDTDTSIAISVANPDNQADIQSDSQQVSESASQPSDPGTTAETTGHDTPAPETPLHQHGFEFLLNAIQQQNSQLDLRKELVDYVDYILSLPASTLPDAQAESYLQQLDNACIQAGLNGINDFLNIHKEKPQATPDHIRHDSQISIQPAASDNTISLKAQEQQFKEKLDQLCQELWNEHFNDENFARFQHCLKEWPEQSLEHQMATYDQLSYVLGSVQNYHEDSSRFLLGWYAHFGNDVPPASADGALHRLHDRIEILLVEHQFWGNIPAKYYDTLQALKQGTPFKPFRMLGLLSDKSGQAIGSLKQRHWLLPDIQLPEQNPNLHYLRICAQWKRYWLPVVVVFLSSVFACMATDSDLVPQLLAGSTLLSLAWLPFIQAPLQAMLYRREHSAHIMQGLTLVWYFALPLIVLFTPLLSTIVLAILLWAYSLLSAFIMGHGLYRSSSLFDEFQQVIRIQSDIPVLYAGFGVLVIACAVIMNLFAEDTLSTPLSLILAMPLIMSLLIPAFIADILMQLIRSRQGLKLYWLICTIYGLLYLNTFVFEWTTWSVDLSDYGNFWLASFSLAFIWIPMALPPRKIAYFLKYAAYVLGILVALRLIFISIWLAYLLYQTAKADYALWKVQQQ